MLIRSSGSLEHSVGGFVSEHGAERSALPPEPAEVKPTSAAGNSSKHSQNALRTGLVLVQVLKVCSDCVTVSMVTTWTRGLSV